MARAEATHVANPFSSGTEDANLLGAKPGGGAKRFQAGKGSKTSKMSKGKRSKAGSDPTVNPTLLLNGESGAIVTRDCLFRDYGYAIDIYWSCGSERFGNPLRLHTFKRHSRAHELVFADQKITYRDQILWFEEYSTPRCISISAGGDLVLRTSSSRCDTFSLEGSENSFEIRQDTTGNCITLGSPSVECNDDRSTGGSECGGVDHRYLPLGMGSCDDALSFRFETKAEECTNGDEFPGNSCF